MISIPKKALEMKGEDSAPVSPEVGDEIPLDGFSGVVTKIDGDNVIVDLKSYNGEPVSYATEKKAEPKGEEAEKADLLERMTAGEE